MSKGRGRPKKEVKQDNAVMVMLTDDLKGKIQAHANQLGISTSQLIRIVLMKEFREVKAVVEVVGGKY